jgi:hypothetical protein
LGIVARVAFPERYCAPIARFHFYAAGKIVDARREVTFTQRPFVGEIGAYTQREGEN